jgi:hypothetical protein
MPAGVLVGICQPCPESVLLSATGGLQELMMMARYIYIEREEQDCCEVSAGGS